MTFILPALVLVFLPSTGAFFSAVRPGANNALVPLLLRASATTSSTPTRSSRLSSPSFALLADKEEEIEVHGVSSYEDSDENVKIGVNGGELVEGGTPAPVDEPGPLERIRSAGAAGALAYGITELFFWFASVPLAIYTYYESTGEILDVTNSSDQAKIAGLSVGFLSFARLVVPLRIAFAAALTPFVEANITSKWNRENTSDD